MCPLRLVLELLILTEGHLRKASLSQVCVGGAVVCSLPLDSDGDSPDLDLNVSSFGYIAAVIA